MIETWKAKWSDWAWEVGWPEGSNTNQVSLRSYEAGYREGLKDGVKTGIAGSQLAIDDLIAKLKAYESGN